MTTTLLSDGSKTPARHQDNFDATRLIAALSVLYGHAFYLAGLNTMPGAAGNEVATIAVKVFFVISGYLVIESWRRDPAPGRYLARRALRIFPGLVVNTLLCAFLLGPLVTTLPLHDYFHSPLLIKYLENIVLKPQTLLPGVFDDLPFAHTVNGSLWTLPVEFGMYLVAPFIVLWGRGQKWRILAGALLLCALSLWAIRTGPRSLGEHAKPIHDALNVAPYFLLGAAWRIIPPARVFNPQIALLCLVLFAFLPDNLAVLEIATYLVLPYAVLSFAVAQPARFGWAGRFGDLSYGVYIYAFPVQQMVAHYFDTTGRPLLNASISLIPTLILSALSWHLLEKRFLLLKPRRAARKLPPATPAAVAYEEKPTQLLPPAI